ncbi:MAG: MarR family transcriptional regulator [Bacillota bacterium]|nr:MAG: MarR family transcriptional regulator [Bacillota bacterium]
MNAELKLTTILFRTFQHVQDIIKNDIASYGLNIAEFGALEVLYHKGSLPIHQIGEKVLMANSSMTYVIDNLTKKEFIRKIKHPTDKRNTMISLTDQGKKYFKTIFEHHQETLKTVYDILSIEETSQLSSLLKKVGYHAKTIGGSQ